ncbi:MAG: hypothetical protein KC505_00720 [Myxococcales bacterium]|nr:hypothetical protein [Myxococcales bacterium]USN51339.1 MAG: hypothetical protein H6731_02730 [Myxococcales bacterium]
MIKNSQKILAVMGVLVITFSSLSASATKYCAYIGKEPDGTTVPGVEGVGQGATMNIACQRALRICNRKLSIAKQDGIASQNAECKRYLVP